MGCEAGLLNSPERGLRQFAMRMLLVLTLSCAPAFAANTDIRVITLAKTNAENASIYTTEIYARDNKTNLVRRTKTKAGTVQGRIHKFYHDGFLVGEYDAFGDSSGFSTEAGTPYAVTIEFWPSKDARSVVIGTNGVILDAFMCTNGMFYPADISAIRKANDIGGDMSKLLSPANVTNTTPDEFRHDIEQSIKKHKDK